MLLKKYKRGYGKEINTICFDVETTIPEIDEPFKIKLAVVGNRGNYTTVYTKEDLTKAILSYLRRHTNYVYATNTEFDFSYLDFDYLYKAGFDLISFSNSPFFSIFNNREKRQKIIFLDTFNFVRMSLKNIGDMVGLEKMEIDFKTCTMEELEVYCKNDVMITERFVEWIKELHQLFDINLCFTFPQLSYRVFRKHYMEKDLEISDNENIRLLERESYKGGRVEVFNFSKYEEVYYNDFNSLYPFVMKNNVYPTKCVEYLNPSICSDYPLKVLRQKIEQEHLNGNGIIARVTVDIPRIKIGKIPIRYKKKTVFPTGSFTASLCSPELEEISEYITNIHEIAIYEMDYLFKGFIDYFYEKRLEAKAENNKIMDLFNKLFMNSLYGKFGQRKFEEKRLRKFDGLYDFHSQALHDTDDEELYFARWIGGKCYAKTVSLDNPSSFVAIASFVTSYARVHLLRYLEKYEQDIIYCDTDSLVLPYPIEESLELGGLKIEKVYHGFQALGNKAYRYDGGYSFKNNVKMWFTEGYKIKGVRQFKVSDGQPTEIIFGENTILANTDKISRMNEGVKRFEDRRPRLIEVNKVFTLDYDKRVRIGNESMPLYIKP